MSEMIYAEFFVNGEKFTVEDYGETGYALYCEGSFVTELSSSDEAEAYEEAINYEKQR